jgi:hypothetical protein
VLLACRGGSVMGGAEGGRFLRLALGCSCVAVLRCRACVCSDRSPEGLCAGSPWPLGMIPEANHI